MKKRMLAIISIICVAFLFQGCLTSTSTSRPTIGKAESEEDTENADDDEKNLHEDDSQAVDCLLMVKVNYESNLVMAKYSINVFLDDEEIATVANGSEYFGSFDVKSGKHELTFEKNGDRDVSNSYSFNVEKDCTAYCSLKSHMDYIEITEKNATGDAVCPDNQHQWEEATCVTLKTCTVCGMTEGELADHTLGNWERTKDATCAEEGEEMCVCSVCGETFTRPMYKKSHTIETWEITKEATCTEKGQKSGVCTVCGQEVIEDIAMEKHTEGDWVIVTEATIDTPGKRTKSCTVCGKEVKNESYTLTTEEKNDWYKKNCKSGSYEDLARSPNDHIGDYVKFSCTIVQICSEAQSSDYYSTYRGATKNGYDNVLYLLIDNYGQDRILEDDKITVYGTFEGLYTYTTVLGDSVTIPKIKVLYYE